MGEKKGVEKEKKKVNKGGKGGQIGKRMPAGRKMAPARPSTSGSSHDDDEGEEQARESQVYTILVVKEKTRNLVTHFLEEISEKNYALFIENTCSRHTNGPHPHIPRRKLSVCSGTAISL